MAEATIKESDEEKVHQSPNEKVKVVQAVCKGIQQVKASAREIWQLHRSYETCQRWPHSKMHNAELPLEFRASVWSPARFGKRGGCCPSSCNSCWRFSGGSESPHRFPQHPEISSTRRKAKPEMDDNLPRGSRSPLFQESKPKDHIYCVCFGPKYLITMYLGPVGWAT